MLRWLNICLLLLSLSLLVPEAQAQCPMCKANVQTARKLDPNSKVGAGLNSGILYLLAAPYLMVGAVAFFWYRQYKRRQSSVSTLSSTPNE